MYVYGMMDQWWIQFLKHCNWVVRSECQVRLKTANFYPVYKKEKMYMGLLVIYFSFVKWSKKLKIPVTEKSKIFQNSYISRHRYFYCLQVYGVAYYSNKLLNPTTKSGLWLQGGDKAAIGELYCLNFKTINFNTK